MSQSFVSIGIDISKSWLDIDGSDAFPPARMANQTSDIAELIITLTDVSPDIIVCEPSGGYERRLVVALQEAGLPIALVNARQIRDFARAKGILAKTDRLDAGVMAAYGAMFRPKPTMAKPSAELMQYVARRRQLVNMLRLEKQYGTMAGNTTIQQSHAQHKGWLEAQIDTLDALIDEHIQADGMMQQRHQVLTSCKGVGDVTAAILIAELPELGDISHGQITSLVGLAPFNCDSGNMRGQRHIRGGRGNVRHALYMATLSATRSNPDIQALYQRLIHKGKCAKVALVACMRQLLLTLNALIRDNRKWKPAYEKI